ncbi:MAG: DinB family protein [Bryobacterales bacterium]|nr:DinB family protein [Bryobacterales bacterium]
MSVTDITALQLHLRYTAWASRRLVEAAAALPEAELTRDFGTADKSVLGTLVHVFAADRIWLARMRGEVPGRFVDTARDMHLSVLQNDWPALLEGWQAFLDGGPDLAEPRPYRDLKGNAYATPLWQVILHLVNHGTHHRGQVSGFLRTMGHPPPPLDLIAFYRTL